VVRPDVATFNAELGEFVLPYEILRQADDPDGLPLEFLQTTHEAATTAAQGDRASRTSVTSTL
jgi:Family of unknown function (DUF5996)